MAAQKKNALNAKQFGDSREEGNNRKNPLEGLSVNTRLPQNPSKFEAQFILSTGQTRIWVMPELVTDGKSVVSLTDDHDANILISPAEALSVAAALQAVAVHLMESEPREIRRHTAPGSPSFEDDV
jgi:hypothetical protein